jgi:hydroxyacylglutathione hydrolase
MVGILRESATLVIHCMLTLRPLPAFADNYIWTLSDPAGNSLVVDPGQAGPVLQAAAEGMKPVAILLTHHHPDHVGGAAELVERFQIPCYAPVDPRIQFATIPVADGDRVTIGELDLEFSVLAVPGHTLSHVAFHGGGYLFCGDTLFSLGCGRLFEGQPAQMLASLDRLAALPGETLVCCGHEYTEANGRFARVAEPDNRERDDRLDDVASLRSRGLPSVPSTLASELGCNPFLRIDQPSVMTALHAQGLGGSDRIEDFAALRAWKDGFAS